MIKTVHKMSKIILRDYIMMWLSKCDDKVTAPIFLQNLNSSGLFKNFPKIKSK